MKRILPLFVFIDACGWEIVRKDPFVRLLAPTRKPLTSVFGYSSACIPSILSGAWPAEHRNWCYFVYDPVNSPFKNLGILKWLPKAVTSRRIFRRWLSKYVRMRLDFKGYFDLYNIPFNHIALFDFTEKKSPLQPKGMNRGPNIFDFLQREGIAYHVSNPQRTEQENLEALLTDIRQQSIDFAFLYWPDLDGLMHRVGNESPQVPEKLRGYELWLDQLMKVAEANYDEVRLYVFSDHGMANCDQHLDLQAVINRLPIKMGQDYAVVYDSTMARFWFFNEQARRFVTNALAEVPQGRVLADQELKSLGTYFPDHQFGELIFLVQEGVLIVPSHMGERPIRAMHGYHPDDKHSFASLFSNQPEIPEDITAIPHMYKLMERDALAAKAANSGKLQQTETAPAPETVLV
jgi:hypothetical protein